MTLLLLRLKHNTILIGIISTFLKRRRTHMDNFSWLVDANCFTRYGCYNLNQSPNRAKRKCIIQYFILMMSHSSKRMDIMTTCFWCDTAGVWHKSAIVLLNVSNVKCTNVWHNKDKEQQSNTPLLPHSLSFRWSSSSCYTVTTAQSFPPSLNL